MRRTDLDINPVFTGSLLDLISVMRREIEGYVSAYQLDSMYDVMFITKGIMDNQPVNNWYWFIRECGTYIMNADSQYDCDRLRMYTDNYSLRRIYSIKKVDDEGNYTIELLASTYTDKEI